MPEVGWGGLSLYSMYCILATYLQGCVPTSWFLNVSAVIGCEGTKTSAPDCKSGCHWSLCYHRDSLGIV